MLKNVEPAPAFIAALDEAERNMAAGRSGWLPLENVPEKLQQWAAGKST